MNLLIAPQYAYPTNHAVVNTVYEQLLPSRGHTVHMIRPQAGVDGVQRKDAPWGNGSLVVFPDEQTGGRLGNIARSRRRSRWVTQALGLMEEVPLDAILVRNELVTASPALKHARRRGIPFIYQLSSPDAEFMITRGRRLGGVAGLYPRVRGRAGLEVRRWITRRATAVLAISQSMRDYLVAEDGLDPAKVFAFPMGVAADAVAEDAASSGQPAETLRRELNLPPGRTIIYSGTIDPVRQPEWMLDVFDRVRARLADAVLLVVTYDTGPQRRALEEEARRRGADVRIVGPVPFREVLRHLRCADVMMSPYPPMMEHKVASPTKSIEALCAALPIVGSAEVDEHVSIFESSGGGVAVPWDRDQFAAALVSLLEQPERRRQMGEQGRRWALAHRTYAHLTDYLEAILKASHSPAALAALPHLP